MSSGNQTTTQKAEPWSAAQGPLTQGIGAGVDMFNNGNISASPYMGERIAGFTDPQLQAQQTMLSQAAAPNASQAAQGYLQRAMSSDINFDLSRVKKNALDTAIPAAAAMFSGSGMTNSTQAMDAVGRAAVDAVSPYEYGAWENAQGRAMQAASMAPSIDAAGYMPAQMMSNVGSQQQAMEQAMLDAQIAQHYEAGNKEFNDLNSYMSLMMGAGGLGGSQSQTVPGASFGQKIGSGILGGAGLYGSLATAGVANPIAAPLAIAGGLAGLL